MNYDILPVGELSLTPPDPEGYDGNYFPDPMELVLTHKM